MTPSIVRAVAAGMLMPRVRVRMLLLLLAVVAAGRSAEATVPVSPPLEPSKARPGWLWIGVKADPLAACPVPPVPPGQAPWKVRHLFVVDGVDVPAAQIPDALRPFCLYEHSDMAADLRSMTPRPLSEVEPSPLGVRPVAGVLEAGSWRMLAKHFTAMAGAIELTSASGRPVRFVVIDTHPTAEGDPEVLSGRSEHGYTLANLARRLLCSGSTGICAADLVSEVSLVYTAFDPDDPGKSFKDESNGGYVGTLGDLATSIYEAVQRWQMTDPRQHLVLHLAVAWDGDLFEGLQTDPATMPVPARAVYLAIRDAACRGALVIAAAGNIAGGPAAEQGPMLPAAWEVHPAPDAQLCDAATFSRRKGARKAMVDRPLLWAAGGITSSGVPLANARPGGLPRSLAVADHAVAETHVPGVPTATLAGSSVATTVVASAAAAVWYLRPELDRFEVMSLLYQAGDDLGAQADFCTASPAGCVIGSAPQNRRRISVCRSVELACASAIGACADQSPVICAPWAPGPPRLTLKPDLIASFEQLAEIGPSWVPESPIIECSPDTVVFNPLLAPPGNPCPQRQLHGVEATPWVGPQPGSNPCPNCLVSTSQGVVLLEISSRFAGVLTDPSLQINGVSYSLAPMLQGGSASVAVAGLGLSGDATASIAFTANGGESAFSPLLVVR